MTPVLMKNRLTQTFLLLLLFFSAVSGLGSVVSGSYKYHYEHLTWNEARSKCFGFGDYSDLAIFYTQGDVDGLLMDVYNVWIGLYKNCGQWKWSNGDSSSNYGWGGHQPWKGADCAIISHTHKRAYTKECDDLSFFLCYDSQKRYKFIPLSKTWGEARSYCRSSQNGDLETLKSDAQRTDAVPTRDFPVWIGLYKDGGTWTWTRGVSEYRNWASGQTGGNHDCVSISSLSKKMSTQDCSSSFPVLCYTDNLVLVKKNKTWEEALEHCRGIGSNHELVSVQPGSDHLFILNKVMEADTEKVWSGLRFLAGQWLWINGADLSYSDLPVCPSDYRHCGALSKNDTQRIETRDCSERRNFLCYKQY